MTLSHPAAILPLRGLGLPTTALVLGCTLPDVPVFLGRWDLYHQTHSLLGVLVLDVVAAMVVAIAWFVLVRDVAVDVAPDVVRSRLAPRARWSRSEWLLAPVAAAVGAATHVGWDELTHGHGWVVARVGWLRDEHGGLHGYQWAQYTSGVVGLVVVVVAVVVHLRGLPVVRPASGSWRVLPRPTLPVAVGAALAAGSVSAVAHAPTGFHAAAFHGVVTSIVASVVVALTVAALWHARRVTTS